MLGQDRLRPNRNRDLGIPSVPQHDLCGCAEWDGDRGGLGTPRPRMRTYLPGGSLLLGKQPKWPDRQRASRRNVLVPTQALLPQGVVAKSLSQGPSAHTCIINTDGDLYCWGNNNRGQVGNGQICFDWNGAVLYTNPCYNGQSGILTLN